MRNRIKGDAVNELENRLRQHESSTRSSSFGADAVVPFRTFLFRHGIHVQDRHSGAVVQRDLLGEFGEPAVETRKRVALKAPPFSCVRIK